jgi:trans-aconitate methyltransferase
MAWDAGLYDSAGYAQEEAGMRLVELSCVGKSDSMLDLGCGTGRFTIELAARAPEGKVTGIDPSKEMLIKAAGRVGGFKNIALLRMPAEEMAFKEEFDLVFSNIVLQWINDQQRVLGLIYRSLKPGGRIALQLPAEAFANIFWAHTDEAIRTLGYEKYFRGFKRPWYCPTKEDYGMLLGEAGFREIDVSYVDYTLRFGGTEGLLNWLVSGRISPYLERLPEKEREYFKYAIVMNLGQSRTEKGIEFVMRRLIALGRK